MAYSTTYYWRIDELNNGSITTGTVWSFMTLSAPPPMGSNESQDTSVTVLDRTATFQLKSGVIIKGGYAGFGEPNADARDVGTYETVLSGDIGILGDISDNSYHVVTGSGCDETAVLDGFTITAGYANEDYPSPHANGGGMYNYSGSPTLINCTFIGNSAAWDGGGMFNGGQSNPTLTGCTFRGNSSIYEGGAISNRTGSPTISNCSFIENSSNHGGGISNWPGNPIVNDCTFSSNSAELGGAVFSYDCSSTLNNCIFNNNYAEEVGGAICNLSTVVPLVQSNSGYPGPETNVAKSIPLLADYTFSDDSSGYESSVNSESDSSTITNCTFSGNSAMAAGGVCYIGQSNPSLDNCTFGNNSAQIGGGFVISQGTATLTDCTFKGNSGEQGGAFYSEISSAVLINCIFRANTSSYAGAAVQEAISSSSLYNCLFNGNTSNLYGGAMYYWYESSPQLFNCTFVDNSALIGNAIVCAVPDGYYPPPPPSFVRAFNCIFWDGGNEIANRDNSIITVTYSDVQGGYSGTGNMTADPCFVQSEYFGPIAYWKFDEADGTIAYDSVGNNHGNVHGTHWTTGKVNSALSFDGNNDFVRSQENPALNNLNAITLQAWIRPRRDGHWHILDKGDGDKRIYAEGTTLTLDGRVRYTGSHAYARSVSHTLTLNTWQHVALTWSRVDNTTRLYHNGVETNYANRTIGTGNPLDDRSHLWIIGARGALGEVTFFDGIIDEAAIYDRVLSPDEIRQNYLSGLNGQAYPDVNTPDYHLLLNSPCINAGDPDYIAEPDETDLDSKLRIIGGRIDMGVYEFNHIPVADAGTDRTIEAQAPWGATVTLDGSGSSDADSTPGTIDDINDFNWYESDPCDPNVDIFLGSGRILDCNLSIGEHIILLEVIDRAGASDTNEVTIIVQDTTPPTITCPSGKRMVAYNERMVAYNDCVYRSGDQYIANNVTTYGIGSGFAGSTSGPLVDQVTGDDMDIMITLTESGGVNWLPDPANGGSDCAIGTDAYNTFGGTTDMTGVIYHGSAGWWVDLTFTGLDPTTEYTFATSAARNNYSGRLTIYTLTGADTYTNASTIGVDVLAENKVRFNTGDNHNEGYVARWTGITATDGSFTVRAEADPCSTDGRKAYSFDVFMLEGRLALECPADTSVAAIGSATATDICDDSPAIVYSDSISGTCPMVIERTWTATDASGNSSSCLQVITVQDTIPPVITCPADVTLQCPADTSVGANGSATAGDTCGSVAIAHSDQWQPGCGNSGILTRTWTATDECGNSSSCVQIITVVDTTPPAITCPVDVTLQCPADTSVEANGSATAGDMCGSVAIAHSDLWQPGCGNSGILTRTWTATDECGNSSSCVQTITVVDTTPPQFQFSVEPTMLWPPDHKMYEITPNWTVSDECDTSPDVSLVSIVANEGDDTIGDGHTSDDIQINEDGSIYLRSERSGTSNDRIYTITYQAVDDCGNTTVRSATVSIPHDFKVLARIADRWLWVGSGRIPEDLNGDGFVNLKDIAIFANNWIQ
jgi:hypothetical protein